MTKKSYIDKTFRDATLDIIRAANEIIYEYQKQGFTLTLRQLYYQFVARGMIENTERSYKRLGTIINDARMAGFIDWEAIEDRTRWLREQAHWNTPSDILHDCAKQYKVDMWEDQKFRPEVWIEKDALVGVIEGVCTELDVPYFACRGYVSQSEQWRAGQRYDACLRKDQYPVVLHLGDHDPSGLDMTRDNQDRLTTFTAFSRAGQTFPVRRLALSMDQVNKFHLPPNPAKVTDSRAPVYIEEFGFESWELDALDPTYIVGLIRGAVVELIDKGKWGKALKRQERDRRNLMRLAKETKK